MRTEKVKAYLPERVEEQVSQGKIQIWPTKHEAIFCHFGDPESIYRKLCNVAAGDDILRQFFFLKGDIDFALSQVSYPLLPRPKRDFLESLEDKPHKEQISKAKDQVEGARGEVRKVSTSFILDFQSIILEDRQVQAAIRRRKTDWLETIVQRYKDRLEKITTSMVEPIIKSSQLMLDLVPLVHAYDTFAVAQNNAELMSSAIDLEKGGEGLEDSLSKLVHKGILQLEIDSLCLECYFKDLKPFRLRTINPLRPDIIYECARCGGNVINNISLLVPNTLLQLFFEGKMPELIVGYSLALSPAMKKIYIHKNVNVVKEAGPTRGVEVDVLGITTSRDIIVVEVTTQSDLNNIMADANKKVDALDGIGLPYSKFVFVTNADMPRALLFRPPNAWIMARKHIGKIVDNIEHIISGEWNPSQN